MFFWFHCFCVSEAKAQYTYVGSSSALGNNCYQITPSIPWQNGAIWYNESIDLNQSFHLQFVASFGNNTGGADGMVFVMQQVANNVLGEDGGGMGFSGFQPSFGIEFDTYQNLDFNDPPYDHIAMLRNGNVNHNDIFNTISTAVQASSTSPIIKDGQDHVIDIFWNPAIPEIQVWFDCELKILVNYPLISEIFPNNQTVFWGFTAATGGLFNQHKVCLDPNILGLPDSYEICQGETVQLGATGSTAGNYSWEPAGLLNNANISNPIASPPVSTEFTVSFTDLCDQVTSQSTTVSVISASVTLPTLLEACEGEIVTITPLESEGDLLWSNGSTGPTLSVNESGMYGVTATNGPCEASDEVGVNFTDSPELNMPSEAGICEGETFLVDLSATGLEISWADSPTAGAIRELFEAGTYTATGGTGNCTGVGSITLSVAPRPTFDLGPDIEQCGSGPIALSANAADATIVWNTGQSTEQISVSESGYYEATASASGCTFVDGVNVLFLPGPVVSIEGEPTFCVGESTLLTASGADSYEWNNGANTPSIAMDLEGLIVVEGTDASTGCTGSASIRTTAQQPPRIVTAERFVKCAGRSILLNPTLLGANTLTWNDAIAARSIQVSEPGSYTAAASNQCGESRVTITVEDEECFQHIYIPNAFTPNGDGLNDLFRVYGERIERFHMQIFDRWGSRVFETRDLNAAWNGSHQNSGYYCPAGIYTVLIELEYEDLSVKQLTGHVSLLR